MRVLWLPRPDRWWRDRVDACVSVGIPCEAYIARLGHDPDVPNSLAQLIRIFQPTHAVVEYATVSQPNRFGSHRTLGWLSKGAGLHVSLWCEEVRSEYPPMLRAAVREHVNLLLVNHTDRRWLLPWGDVASAVRTATLWGSADERYFGATNPPRGIEYDVVMPGTFWGKTFPLGGLRVEVLNALSRDFRVAIMGARWENSPIAPTVRIFPPTTDPARLAAFYASGRVVLHVPSMDAERYYPERVWCALAAGRALLMKRVPGMEKDGFQAGVNVAVYDDAAGAVRAVSHLVASSRWAEMGRMGRAFFEARHTWRHRILQWRSLLGL